MFKSKYNIIYIIFWTVENKTIQINWPYILWESEHFEKLSILVLRMRVNVSFQDVLMDVSWELNTLFQDGAHTMYTMFSYFSIFHVRSKYQTSAFPTPSDPAGHFYHELYPKLGLKLHSLDYLNYCVLQWVRNGYIGLEVKSKVSRSNEKPQLLLSSPFVLSLTSWLTDEDQRWTFEWATAMYTFFF